jgi:hypothetical protein
MTSNRATCGPHNIHPTLQLLPFLGGLESYHDVQIEGEVVAKVVGLRYRTPYRSLPVRPISQRGIHSDWDQLNTP